MRVWGMGHIRSSCKRSTISISRSRFANVHNKFCIKSKFILVQSSPFLLLTDVGKSHPPCCGAIICKIGEKPVYIRTLPRCVISLPKRLSKQNQYSISRNWKRKLSPRNTFFNIPTEKKKPRVFRACFLEHDYRLVFGLCRICLLLKSKFDLDLK